MEWLANLRWQYVIVAVIVLTAVRLALGKSKSPIAKQTAEISESLAIALALVFLIIRPFIIQAFYIPSGSMHPTLLEKDRLLVNKFIYRFKETNHGDIIVFRAPEAATMDGTQKDFIKRCIGLPGDKIQVVPGYVKIGDIVYNHADLRSLLGNETASGEVIVRLYKDNVYVSGKPIDKKTLAEAADMPDAKVVIHPGGVIHNGKFLNEPYLNEDPDIAFSPIIVPKNHLFMMGDNRNDSNDSRMWGPLERNRVQGKAMFIFWPLNRIRWIR